MLQRGARREGAAVEAPRRRRSWRQCYHCRRREKKEGRDWPVRPPCQGSLHFPIFRNSSMVFYLIEAFNQV